MSFRLNNFFLLSLLTLSLASCNSPSSQSARQAENAQYTADTQAKAQDLMPTQGHYTGTMHLLKSNQDFAAVMDLQVVFDTEKSPQAQNPSETITIAKLSGGISFPALDAIAGQDVANLSELVGPMGGFQKILIDYGDYNPINQILLLPYSVGGYSNGYFGQLQGTFSNNQFTGTWFAKPFGEVATFTLSQVPSLGSSK